MSDQHELADALARLSHRMRDRDADWADDFYLSTADAVLALLTKEAGRG